MRVTMYGNVWDRTGVAVDPRKVIDAIRSGRWKDQIKAIRKSSGEDKDELKKRLPAVTFAGVFEKRRGGVNSLLEYTGILVADIDRKVGGMTADIIARDPHVVFQFKSPSGGMKIGVALDCRADDFRSTGFETARAYFRNHFKLELDKACKDINRLCFVSWDKDAFWNDDVDPLWVPGSEPKRNRRTVSGRVGGNPIMAARAFADKYVGAFVPGQRNNWMFAFATSCNKRGVDVNACLAEALGMGLGDRETEQAVRSAYKYTEDHGTLGTSSTYDQEERMLRRHFEGRK